MGLLKAIADIKDGIDMGEKLRGLLTELRLKEIDVFSTDNPDSPYYERAKNIGEAKNTWNVIGTFMSQVRHPIELYRNACHVDLRY